jgi:hypothetical protein
MAMSDENDDDGREPRSLDDAAPDSASAARRRFEISGTITVAGRALCGYSANDNGLAARPASEK